jgi:hypothetical protein
MLPTVLGLLVSITSMPQTSDGRQFAWVKAAQTPDLAAAFNMVDSFKREDGQFVVPVIISYYQARTHAGVTYEFASREYLVDCAKKQARSGTVVALGHIVSTSKYEITVPDDWLASSEDDILKRQVAESVCTVAAGDGHFDFKGTLIDAVLQLKAQNRR